MFRVNSLRFHLVNSSERQWKFWVTLEAVCLDSIASKEILLFLSDDGYDHAGIGCVLQTVERFRKIALQKAMIVCGGGGRR